VTAWLIAAVILAIIGGAIYFHRTGRREGAAATRDDVMQGVHDDIRKAQDVRQVVDALPDSALDERVSKWTRRE
jgi:hypothetical protein